MLTNGTLWKDIDGNSIQAHGGMILEHDGIWYWYGENKGAPNCPGKNRVDVIGISCYSSVDLKNWKYEGLVIESEKTDEQHPLHYTKVCERPKVIYCEKTGKFVLWMHIDDKTYQMASVGVAVSDSPVGPFVLKTVIRPNGQESRDMTVFKDDDGVAYLVHSKDGNRTLNIARLTDDYEDVDGYFVSVLVDQIREAPALCKHKGKYYMVTSGCTGWKPNSALYAEANFITGKWHLVDNPCEGENYRNTFGGQSTYIFEYNGQKYLMLDHWIPHDLQNSGYSILPISFDEENEMTVSWVEEFNV